MLSKNRKDTTYNEWDYRSVPSIPFRNQKYSVDRAIFKLINSKNEEQVGIKIQIRRARQLAYIEPWFQFFLPDKLKGMLFISTLGKKFWVIGAVSSLAASNFKFYQKEIRQTLENHLNNISKKNWDIPDFYVHVIPLKNDDVPPAFVEQPVTDLSVRSNKSLLAVKTNRSIDDILASMMDSAKKHGR